VKLVRPWKVKVGQKTIRTLDFEADKFVVIAGKDAVEVKPVLKLNLYQVTAL